MRLCAFCNSVFCIDVCMLDILILPFDIVYFIVVILLLPFVYCLALTFDIVLYCCYITSSIRIL